MSFKKCQIPAVTLYSGLAAAGTSMRITPVLKDLDGNTITLAALGTAPYQLTIDPKISGYEEIIGFTTIIDNGDNTMTLTGLSRDLASSSLATPGTGKQHGAGAVIVFSINPQDIARLANLEDDQTFAGQITFAVPPVGVNPGGVDDASTSVKGIAQEATNVQIDADTATGSTGARLFASPAYLKLSKYYLQLPTSGQKAALAGQSGTAPSAANKYLDYAFGAQTVANLDTTITLGGSDTKYPSQNAVKTYVDANVPSYKNGATSKNASDASTTQNIAHGLGRIPKHVKITAVGKSGLAAAAMIAVTAYNGTTQSSASVYESNGSATTAATFSLNITNANGDQTGVVTFDATNIIITWTKTGGADGTYQLLWEAQ